MLIASRFDGDEWLELQRAQHDVYSEALRVLLQRSSERYRCAIQMTENFTDPLYDTLNALSPGCDHRCFQNAHDHLAAFWRKTHRYVQPDLFIEDTTALAGEWLIWLGKDVDSWSKSAPWLTRLLCLVFVQQNVKAGYDAEDRLLCELQRLYPLTCA